MTDIRHHSMASKQLTLPRRLKDAQRDRDQNKGDFSRKKDNWKVCDRSMEQVKQIGQHVLGLGNRNELVQTPQLPIPTPLRMNP
jgi:hypothetical protein